MTVHAGSRVPLQELPAEPLPAAGLDGSGRAALSALWQAPGRRDAGAVGALTVEEARIRHAEALRALASAEASLANARRRGDPWGTVEAHGRYERAAWAYRAADDRLIRLLLAGAV